ncbi:hypothetical protein [Rubrivirga sp. IMCC43871]|uniref:hypothetical protein n=1 Tax=Rubrivirga sp. IMCC43871 TaxID=3391575 RepID=UPI00398FAFBF
MRALWLPAFALALAACGGSGAATDGPDRDRYGYRVGSDPDRETVLIRPVSDSTRYLIYPAVVQTVDVRPAGRPAPGDAVAVEVLVEGALPDACAELTDLRQSRQSQFIDVALEMRQPRETVCAAVTRPFRFYVVLDGGFEAGSYTLRLNGAPHPFQVLPARDAAVGTDDG